MMGVGILCVVAGIVGGGVTLAGQEIHTLTSVWREVILGVFGVLLMGGSLVLHSGDADSPANGASQMVEDDDSSSADPEDWADIDRWREGLSRGHLSLELDTSSGTKVATFIRVVGDVLREKGFREETGRRARIILHELLTNVVEHVGDKTAQVTVKVQDRHLRIVSINVCDRGPGIDQSIFWDYERRLAAGEREHGLLLALRLATTLRVEQHGADPSGMRSCVACDLIEPPAPRSMLFEFNAIPWVRMEYTNPKVYWLGTESYVDMSSPRSFITRLTTALQNGWRPILDLYLKHLTDSRYLEYLVVEVAGDEVVTEMEPGALGRLRAVLESYFPDYFRTKRVILLASDTDSQVRGNVSEWAQQWQLEYFDSDVACRERLEQLSASDRG